MPGFNPQTLAYRVLTGNQVAVLIGDQTIAFAQTVSPTLDFGTEGIYGIGSQNPQEIQQLRNSPSITLDNFALTSLGNDLIQNGQNFASIVANNSFNICIADGTTGEARLTFVGAVAQNYSESIGANRPITDAISFLALDVLDATGLSIMNGPSASNTPSTQGSPVNGGLGVAIANLL